jgi:glycosyltransferase involved in cell wall biosynthesis
LRILHVHTRYRQPGGEDGVVAAERGLLADAGHEVIPLDLENPTSPAASMIALARAPWNGTAAERVAVKAQDTKPDVVHVHNTWFALSPAVFPKVSSLGVPTVATFHNYRLVCVNAMLFRDGHPCEDCVGRGPWPGVQHGCYKGSRMASAAVAATIKLHRSRSTWSDHLSRAAALTDFAKERLEAGGIPSNRISIVPNFVTDPGPRSQPATDSEEVLFVGRLTHEKGIESLIRTWDSIGSFRLTVIGDGPLIEGIRAIAPSNVVLLGARSSADVVERMLQARALVLPSLVFEVQPLVLIEALAAGLPIVHSDAGALGALVGGAGSAFMPENTVELAERILQLENASEVERRSKAARLQYESHYAEARALALRLRLYQDHPN